MEKDTYLHFLNEKAHILPTILSKNLFPSSKVTCQLYVQGKARRGHSENASLRSMW